MKSIGQRGPGERQFTSLSETVHQLPGANVSSAIQLTSHVLPASSEKDCSK